MEVVGDDDVVALRSGLDVAARIGGDDMQARGVGGTVEPIGER